MSWAGRPDDAPLSSRRQGSVLGRTKARPRDVIYRFSFMGIDILSEIYGHLNACDLNVLGNQLYTNQILSYLYPVSCPPRSQCMKKNFRC